jgi:uncharacterized protein (DUF2141 family)
LIVIFGFSSDMEQNHKLTITISNIKNLEGKKIQMGVFTKDGNFPDDKSLKNFFSKAVTSTVKIEIEIPYGEYAIALYHDINNNGKLDKNMFGIPKEPYAFSQNFKPSMSAPDFDDCKFTFSEKNNSISIQLIQ